MYVYKAVEIAINPGTLTYTLNDLVKEGRSIVSVQHLHTHYDDDGSRLNVYLVVTKTLID